MRNVCRCGRSRRSVAEAGLLALVIASATVRPALRLRDVWPDGIPGGGQHEWCSQCASRRHSWPGCRAPRHSADFVARRWIRIRSRPRQES